MQQLLIVALLCASVLALPQYPADSDGCVTCKWIVAYTEAYSASETEEQTYKSMEALCDELNEATAFQCHWFLGTHFRAIYKLVKSKRTQDDICGIHGIDSCMPVGHRWTSYKNPYASVSEDVQTKDEVQVDGLEGKLDRIEVELVIDHNSVGDLTIELEHDGKKIALVHRPECSPSGFYWITLSDSGKENIQTACNQELFRDLPTSKRSHHYERKPIEGVYSPKDALKAFSGSNPNGKWLLTVFDNVKNEFQGTLNYWKIHMYGVSPKSDNKVSAKTTIAKGDGLLYATPGQTAEFTIYPKDQWGNNVTAAEPDFGFELSCGIAKKAVQPAPKQATCQAGSNSYDCSDNIELLSRLAHNQMGGTRGNDIWGWEDPVTGKLWAIVCQTSGTAFVDVTDPRSPQYVAYIPTATTSVTWRDAKVYKDHAFIIAESTRHGMQVFDLTRLRSMSGPPQIIEPDVHYTRDLTNSHNIYINEDTGYAYIVGATGAGCGGIYIVDINEPKNPQYVTCHSPRYTHDIECIVYDGPDTRYTGREICFCYDAGYGFTIKDVTNKQSVQTIGVYRYPGTQYCHQGWITKDRETVLMNDELGATGRTYVFDVTDLTNPKRKDGEATDYYYHENARSSQHNNYIMDGYVFQSNYQAGVRILDISNPKPSTMFEIGYLDTAPAYNGNSSGFNGQWSLYPYFDDFVVSNDIQNGLFVFKFSPGQFHIVTSTSEVEFCDNTGRNSINVEVLSYKDGKKYYRREVGLYVRGLPSYFSTELHRRSNSHELVLHAHDAEPGHYPFEIVAEHEGNEVVHSMVANVYGGKPTGQFSTQQQADGSVKVTYSIDKKGQFPLRITYKGEQIASSAPVVITVEEASYLPEIVKRVGDHLTIAIVSSVCVVVALVGCFMFLSARRRRRAPAYV